MELKPAFRQREDAVRDHGVDMDDAMPYGGTKDSGIGREGVRYAMEEFSELRTLVLKP